MRNISRKDAISDVRSKLLALCDSTHSVCEVAARKGIFCHGFKHHSTEDLFKTYDWIVEAVGVTSREQLEKYANLWQLARQEFHGVRLACDVQILERDTCLGWDEFSNKQLAKFYHELCSEDVQVDNDVVSESPANP